MNDVEWPYAQSPERMLEARDAEIERLNQNLYIAQSEAEEREAIEKDLRKEIERLRDKVVRLSTLVDTERGLHDAEIERLKDALVISNTTITNLHSEIEKIQKEIKELRIQILDDLSTAYFQQAEIKKLKEENRIVISALENMHMMESETVEELREENELLRTLAKDFYSDKYINEVLRDGK